MKLKTLILTLAICAFSQLAKAHAVQVQYCVNCAGDLRIWVEHWHGTENPATTTMTITVDVGAGPVTYTSSPGGGVQNVPAGSLPGCSTPLIFGTSCPNNQDNYNDWVYYDFLGLPTNQNIVVTIVSGNTAFTSDCGGMFPFSFNFIIGGTVGGQDQYVCEGSASAPINYPPSATWTNDNPGIGLAASGNGDIPSFVPIGPPGTTATIDVTNSCGTSSFDIVIQANPQPTFVVGNGGASSDSVCLGTPFTFQDASNIPPPDAITQWDWDWGDGTPNGTNQNETHTYAAPGDYQVVLTAGSAAGCVAATFAVPVHVAPIPTPTFVSDVVCANTPLTPTQLTDQSAVAPGSIDQWAWDIGNDGSVEYTTQNPTHVFPTGGTYQVELTVTSAFGCTDNIVNDVTVNHIPVPDFTSDSVCIGNATTFTDNSAIAGGANVQWDWDFGGGNTATGSPANFTFAAAGNNNVTLTVTSDGGCPASVTLPAYVRSLPVASFTATDECVYDAIATANTSNIGIGTMTYEWDFGDGSPIDVNTAPTHQYATAGNYTVTLTATSNFNCVHTVDAVVDIYEKPNADFLVTAECVSFANAYTDQSAFLGGNVNGDVINSWKWDTDLSGTPNYVTQSPSHTYPAEGIYTTELIVETAFGCSDTVSYPVTVYPEPFVNFNFGNLCFNDLTDFEQLATVSNVYTLNTVDVFDWDFGDGNTTSGALVQHTYGSHGQKFVNLTATTNNGCVHDTTLLVDIKPLPTPEFSTTTICENTPPTTFGDLSTTLPGYGIINDWHWDFGNGAQAFTQATVNNYGVAGVYNATLTVTTTDGCVNAVTHPVTVHEKPVAAFMAPITQICSPDTINYIDQSQGTASMTPGIDVVQWKWNFFNGGGSIDQNPTAYYTAAGPNPDLYDVELIVQNSVGCYDTVLYADYVEIFPTPEAEFTYKPYELYITDTEATFYNNSVNGHTYNWSFGDGTPDVSTFEPTHMYPTVGAADYQVILDVYNFGGMCHDADTVMIHVEDILIFHVPNIFTPDGDDYNEMWHPVFFSGYDPYDFHLMVFNRYGEVIWESYDASAGWDGHYGDGGLVDDGVYIWQIDFKLAANDERQKHQGHVTVLK